jgi:hypothetical protein
VSERVAGARLTRAYKVCEKALGSPRHVTALAGVARLQTRDWLKQSFFMPPRAMCEGIAALPERRAAGVVRYFQTIESNDEAQPGAAAMFTPPPAVTYHVVKTDVLNLRAGPGAAYPVVTKLPAGNAWNRTWQRAHRQRHDDVAGGFCEWIHRLGE